MIESLSLRESCDYPHDEKVILNYCDVIMGAMTSQITRLVTQPFIQAQIKENIKASRHSPVAGEFPAHLASNAENVPIWWRHHERRKARPVCIILRMYYMSDNTHTWILRCLIFDYDISCKCMPFTKLTKIDFIHFCDAPFFLWHSDF